MRQFISGELVSDIVAEITSASLEQSSGISQVGDAVSQMDQVTQQNAALVEESAAAAESLKGQAQQLVHAVAVFKLPNEGQAIARQASSLAHAPAAGRRQPAVADTVARSAIKSNVPAKLATPAAPRAPATIHAKADADDWSSF